MTASLRRTVIVSVAALGVAFLLVWAASSSPVVVDEQQQPRAAVPQDAPDQTPVPDSQKESGDDESSDRGLVGTSSWAEDLVVLALVMATLGLFGLAVRQLLAHVARSLPGKQLVLDLAPRPDAVVGREAIARDRDRFAAALAGSDVRDGIVGCWVLMEEAAAESGVARRPSETATELVVRFLHALDVDPRPVAELARLYHEARFSSHTMGAGARARAQEALASIHRELGRARVTP